MAEKWFKPNYNTWGFSEKEKQQLSEIVLEYEKGFTSKVEFILEELRFDIAIHFSKDANTHALEKYKHDLYFESDFNKGYLDLIYIPEGKGVKISQSTLFYQFAYTHAILKEPYGKGHSILEGVLYYKITDWMLRNGLTPKEVLSIGDINIPGGLDTGPFVDQLSKEFFEYLVNNWLRKEKKLKSALSYIYYRMNQQNEVGKYKITSTQSEYVEYWNRNYGELFLFNEGNSKLDTRFNFRPHEMESKYTTSFNANLEAFNRNTNN